MSEQPIDDNPLGGAIVTPDQQSVNRVVNWFNKAKQRFNPSSPESKLPAEQPKPWEGLISDDPNELAKALKIPADHPKRNELAQALTNVHLMNEPLIAEVAYYNLGLRPYEVVDLVSHYRRESGHTLSLPEDNEEVRKIFPELSLTDGDIASLRGKFQSIDLADTVTVSAVARSNSTAREYEILGKSIETYVQSRVNSDLTAKAEYIDSQPAESDPSQPEKAKTSWNFPLNKEATTAIVQSISNLVSKIKITPEIKQKIDRFGKATMEEAKGGTKTLMFKDTRDAAAVAARVISDFSPEAGLAMAVANVGVMGSHEIGSFGKKRMALKESRKILKTSRERNLLTDDQLKYIDHSLANIGLNENQRQKFINDNSSKFEFGYAVSAWFNETTLGKLSNNTENSKLTTEERRAAAITGFVSAGFGNLIGEGAAWVVRTPGYRASVRMAAMRVTSQYLLPRIIDKGLTKVIERTGMLDTEEKKKEWVDLSLQSMRLTTTATATLFTGLSFLSSPAAGQIETTVEESVDDLKHTVSSLGESAVDNIKSTPLVSSISEAIELTPTPTQEVSVDDGAGGVIPTPESIPQVGSIDSPQSGTEAPEQPLTELDRESPFETAESSAGQNLTNEAPPPPVPGLQNPQTTIYAEQYIDTNNDGVPDRIGFDTNGDNEYDSYWIYGENQQITGAILPNGEYMLLDPNSQGIPGIQTKLANLHPNWRPDEVAEVAAKTFSAGITADNEQFLSQITRPVDNTLGEATSEIVFKNNDGVESFWYVDKDGNIVGGKLSDGRELYFDPNSEGVPGLQLNIANTHPDWTPDEVARAAQIEFENGTDKENFDKLINLTKPEATISISQGIPGMQEKLINLGWEKEDAQVAAARAFSQGIRTDDIDPNNAEIMQKLEALKPVETPVLGERVPENDLVVDPNNDGKPEGTWYRDENGIKVGAKLSDGETELSLKNTGSGVERYQYEIANKLNYDPEVVARLAQRAYEAQIDFNDTNELTQFCEDELPKVTELPRQPLVLQLQDKLAGLHPDWTKEELQRAAYLESLKGTSPDNTGALKVLEVPFIPTSEDFNIDDLVKGVEFDSDGDGKPDTWWLKDKDTGEIKAGVLSSGETLAIGERGGPTGVAQEYLVNNSNLNPEEVSKSATRIVNTEDLQNIDEAKEALLEKTPNIKVIELVNQDIARFSLENHLRSLGLNSSQAHGLAFGEVKIVSIEPFQNILAYSPGETALGELKPKVEIGGKVYDWNNFDWNTWLKEKGMLN